MKDTLKNTYRNMWSIILEITKGIELIVLNLLYYTLYRYIINYNLIIRKPLK